MIVLERLIIVKKFLMIATVPSMIGQFNMDNLHILLQLGYEVHIACNFKDTSVWSAKRIEEFEKNMSELNIKCIQIDFSRSPYQIKKMIRCYKEVKKLIAKENYTIIHCHTPVAGLITRLAANNEKAKVIYTAHGFHFYKGAPIKNWLIYYPIEKICSYMTDVLITINKEDFALAQNRMKAKKVVYIPGVGVNIEKYKHSKNDAIRKEFNIPQDARLLLSVGELNKNKNHEIIIRALSELRLPEAVYYVIVGKGELEPYLKTKICENNLQDRIFLTGYRKDILDFYHASDIYVFPSFREGLSVALMEAMACGLSVIASDIRGNQDLVDSNGGIMFKPHVLESVKDAIDKILSKDEIEIEKMGKYNESKMKSFSSDIVKKMMEKIYKEIDSTTASM